MAQLCIKVQDLYNDLKCFDRAYNKDAPYAMVAINQYSEPHQKILWNPDPSTLTLNLEEKLLCRQQY